VAEIARSVGLSADEIELIRRAAIVPLSLAQPVGEENGAEFGDLLADDSAQLPDEEVAVIVRNELLRSILDTLSTREREVLERRFGLDGSEPSTLDELGRTFNVTRERIRQIENRSLKKLHALARAQSLEA
jgi:RNA polymerase primary sigma factor